MNTKDAWLYGPLTSVSRAQYLPCRGLMMRTGSCHLLEGLGLGQVASLGHLSQALIVTWLSDYLTT